MNSLGEQAKCDLLDNSALGKIVPHWAFGVWSRRGLDHHAAQELGLDNKYSRSYMDICRDMAP